MPATLYPDVDSDGRRRDKNKLRKYTELET